MSRKYKIEFTELSLEMEIEVDTDVFTVDRALDTLEFFSWYYDEEGDLIDEVVKKYAAAILRVGSEYSYNAYGIRENFKEEGFASVDGSYGIKLIEYDPIDFGDLDIELEIVSD